MSPSPRSAGFFALMPVVILCLLGVGEVVVEGPTDQLRLQVERVLDIVRDPEFQGATMTRDRRAAIRAVAARIFDFEEMARRSLGRHWHARSPAERAEFTELFTNLLERAYIARIERYGGEPITYRQARIEGDRATVQTTIVARRGSEVPVDYRMRHEGATWLVYDVVIEGVSLVANYRTQFNKIILTSSWEELLRRMKDKATETQALRPARHSKAHCARKPANGPRRVWWCREYRR